MNTYVVALEDVGAGMTSLVGGKSANLGELSRIEGIRVPEGFCVTTEAFSSVMGAALDGLLDELAGCTERDSIGGVSGITAEVGGITAKVSEVSARIREVIEGLTIPGEIVDAITGMLRRFGELDGYAVRSSATAEDLPAASFAGQQDSYLNVVGPQAILQHISQCWASLFTLRAVIYRLQNGFDHRKVRLAVVVQKMVVPQASGILFTADPVTGNRKMVSIDAGPGLGDALVSGLVNADVYKLRDGRVIERLVRGSGPVLADEQLLRLEGLGRIIEARFGRPQDIEWCLAGGVFWFVQSRPITTLYPIPSAPDPGNRVYVSVGHQQMMTDAIRPLGISFWNLTAFRPMFVAGGRFFVDVTQELALPARRAVLLGVLGKNDPLIKDALGTILELGDFVVSLPDENGGHSGTPSRFQTLGDYDVSVVDELVARSAAAIDELRLAIRGKSGTELIDFILADVQQLKKIIGDPRSFGVIMTAMNAASWINEKMWEWLGEKNVADTIAQSVPGNITSEMGLALLDVADIIRQYPRVVEYLSRGGDLFSGGGLSCGGGLPAGLDELAGLDLPAGLDALAGGRESRDAIRAFLDRYGMRCAGEIDITRTRWSERPAMLVPLILGNVRNFSPGAGKRKFEQGLREASVMEQELLSRLRQLPDGAQKALETKRMIDMVRNLSGYREYPKYAMVSRYFIYKQALLREAGRLVEGGVLGVVEDIYYLSFEELGEVLRTDKLDRTIIETRRSEYGLYEKLTPPRVMTSDGEIITGAYKRAGLPAGAISGLAVSSGVVEGRARVILKMEDAVLEDGDILVTRFTDPSWTPLFVSIKGLVTEVGGLMTHGAVIAREYGLPAVVGVEGATRLIKDGERIRVNGTEGYVIRVPVS
ncbi:MAG TPA: phosphoenolpyruvate synthase [Puia sp.]|nr:phosphoenolpyruvate synthase [Puia sp.]